MVDIINIRCLDEKTLSSYLDEKLSYAEREKIEKHVADCNTCLGMLLVAYESQRKKFSIRLLRGLTRTISNSLRARMQSSQAEKPKKKRSKLKWLLASVFFFSLSFVIRHYFLQFLAISVVFGFKWVMEGEAAKRIVMIFKGMNDKDSETRKNRINQVKKY